MTTNKYINKFCEMKYENMIRKIISVNRQAFQLRTCSEKQRKYSHFTKQKFDISVNYISIEHVQINKSRCLLFKRI